MVDLRRILWGVNPAGEVVNDRAAKVSADPKDTLSRPSLKYKRVFRSQVFVPRIERLYEWTSRVVLPSARIRRRAERRYGAPELVPEKPEPLHPRDKAMSRWLEYYMIVTTALLFLAVWSQSHACAWHAWWTWILRPLVVLLMLVRISEILLQSVEVVLDRIDVDPASGLVTLVIYAFQAVAIFAICSEYAEYVSRGHAFKTEVADFPSNAWDYAYLAGTNLVTFGAAYLPQTFWARLTVACSSLVFVLLFSVLLAFVVAQIRPDRTRPSQPKGDFPKPPRWSWIP